MLVIFIVVVVVTKDYATTAAVDDDDDAYAIFLIEIEIDQGLIEVVGVVFVTAAKVTKIDSLTSIDDDNDC